MWNMRGEDCAKRDSFMDTANSTICIRYRCACVLYVVSKNFIRSKFKRNSLHSCHSCLYSAITNREFAVVEITY